MPKANGNHEENQLAVVPPPVPSLSQEIENVLLLGDLSRLTPDQRLSYYNTLCRTLGLNPMTRPFDYLVLNGRMQLYAKKDCTDQLRKVHGVSVDKATHTHDQTLGIYIVNVEGHDRTDRKDVGTGVVTTAGLKGDALANAIMKSETKAKRRFTLSICGLGMLDESELESMGQRAQVAERSPLPRPPARKAKAKIEAEVAKLEKIQAEVKAEPNPEPKPEPKPLSFPVKFWRAAKQTKKSDDEIRQYLAWMGYEKTAEVPPEKQQECLDWAASG